MTIPDHVARFVAMKQRLGYQFTTNAGLLSSFARFAEARDEAFLRADTALQWAATAPSRGRRVKKLHIVHALAIWLHAEDTRHEVPRRDAFGPMSCRRPPPHPLSIPDIQALLSAALAMRPAGTITPLTWHHMFGLIAATGIRISEALALVPDDLTADGLVIRETKFRKSRMVDREGHDKDASRQRRRIERSPGSCQHEAEISRMPADPVESFGHEPAGFLERVDIGTDSLELNLPGHRNADTQNDESRPGPGKPGLDEPEQREESVRRRDSRDEDP